MAVVSAPASRNQPCPCGSGRRYKDCHGAIASPAADTTVTTVTAGGAAPRSKYRAPDTEWKHLPEDERDRLGELMERALAHQVAGRLDDAKRAYQDVLAVAPGTHDALHMTGVIAMTHGELDAAERLISAALALRPAYPAISHNLQLVHDARRASRRALPEALCERALPLMVELALAPAAARARARPQTLAANAPVHLVGRIDAEGEDDGWLLRRLASILAPARPAVWATDTDTEGAIGELAARRIDGPSGFYPRGGIQIFAGIEFTERDWLAKAGAERVIVVCGSAPPSLYLDQLRAIARDGARPVELVFPTLAVAARFGLDGVVLPPPLELHGLLAAAREPARPVGAAAGAEVARFSAGIVGQRQRSVVDARDATFLHALAEAAGRLAIYDPGTRRFRLGDDPSVRFVPRAANGLAPFLAAASCYCVRRDPWWEEGDGRDVLTAMALSVPVVCPRDSSFAEWVDDGRDGLLYDTEPEALEHVRNLRSAPALAAEIGAKGRSRLETLIGADAGAARYRQFVLGGRPQADVPGNLRVA